MDSRICQTSRASPAEPAPISVSPSQLEAVRTYIARQPEHHRKRTFDEEYLALLAKAGVKYERDFVLG